MPFYVYRMYVILVPKRSGHMLIRFARDSCEHCWHAPGQRPPRLQTQRFQFLCFEGKMNQLPLVPVACSAVACSPVACSDCFTSCRFRCSRGLGVVFTALRSLPCQQVLLSLAWNLLVGTRVLLSLIPARFGRIEGSTHGVSWLAVVRSVGFSQGSSDGYGSQFTYKRKSEHSLERSTRSIRGSSPTIEFYAASTW